MLRPAEPTLPGMAAVAELYPAPIGPEPKPLSYGRRLTARRNADLARGVHPVTRRALLHEEWQRTCGDCWHLFQMPGTAGSYWKCGMRASRGPATDVRKSWPACDSFREDGC